MDDRRESLLKEYSEVSSNFRLLTDIRFKLLGLVPVATVVAAIAAASMQQALGGLGFVVSLFGLMVVLGLITYNVRNDQLYDELVGRAADIERSLGIRDGSYGFRPRPWLRLSLGPLDLTLDHGNALVLIYGATVVVWVTGVIAPLIELLRWAYLEQLGRPPLLRLVDVQGAVVLLASVIAALLTIIAGHWARTKKEQESEKLHDLACQAMQRAKDVDLDAQSAARDEAFLELCIKLAGRAPNDKSRDGMRRRAEFHAAQAHTSRYLPQHSNRQFSAHLIASLCDLPPRWILDCTSGRRASLKEKRLSRRGAQDSRLSMPKTALRHPV
jgi:hypothetical protein